MPHQSPYAWSSGKSKVGYNLLKPKMGYNLGKVSARVGVTDPNTGNLITNYGPYIFIKPPENFGWNNNSSEDGIPLTVELWRPSLWEVNQAMKIYYQEGKFQGKVKDIFGNLIDIVLPDKGMAGYVDDITYGIDVPVRFRIHSLVGGENESSNNQYGGVDGNPGDWVRALKDGSYSIVRNEDVEKYKTHSCKKFSLNQYWYGMA